ncbi:hypothetical protein ACJ72_06467 [Emergomyces africanus]|uniref:Uncharacterized protein n=1 Tax=Emergomyces africanus TaxID=1955775 RepID=A0A1B7NQY9_9EURO|nr:hypothetical protein ACJ72_06467 [Emergomyces africanus]
MDSSSTMMRSSHAISHRRIAGMESTMPALRTRRVAKSTPPVDRIRDHENASSPCPSKADELGLKVVASRINGLTGQSLEEFPNEVLTQGGNWVLGVAG